MWYMIKMFKTYNKVKNVFKKPKLYWKFGKWKHDPCLPIWRCGNTIKIAKHSDEYTASYNFAKYLGSEWTDVGKQRHPILSKIFKPKYVLPIWLSFYIFNRDIMWKTKYEDYRFEYPGQFTIVCFGWSLSLWLNAPENDDAWDIYSYWESILWYLNECELNEEYKSINKKWLK